MSYSDGMTRLNCSAGAAFTEHCASLSQTVGSSAAWTTGLCCPSDSDRLALTAKTKQPRLLLRNDVDAHFTPNGESVGAVADGQ